MRLRLRQTPTQTTKRHGFTLVELIVVITVIGILAAITVVAVNVTRQNAIESTMQSDLRGAASQLKQYRQQNGQYPSDQSLADNGKGLIASGDDTYTYAVSSDQNNYCLTVSSSGTNNSYYVSDSSTTPKSGSCSLPPAPMVTTLAGSGTAGSANGTGTAAQFNFPGRIAIDSSGTIYVADIFNNLIRKITSSGVVTTLAGSGTAGSANGTGTAAQFNSPGGIAVDSSGTVYVADTNNNLIRKITSAGVVTTLAGSGTAGSANGTGTTAQFNSPGGIAVDSSGTVYVADSTNNLIRKITPAGVVTTLAGSGTQGYADGSGASAEFYAPVDVAVNAWGVVYVADTSNNLIRMITPTGVVTTLAGSGAQGYADGSGASAEFHSPYGIDVDATGNVYVADTLNNRIRKVSPNGIVTTVAGSDPGGYADGSVTTAQFGWPQDVAINAAGNIYVSDSNNNRIRVIK